MATTKRSKISQVTLRNGKDDNGKWIDLVISVGSWVTMRPAQRGNHAVKKRKLNDLSAHWKAQVVGFVISRGGGSVDEIVVAHAYSPQDMLKEDIARSPTFPKLEVNDLCSSEFSNKVSAQSITSVLEIHHHTIGNLLFPDFSSSSLRDQGVWFHKYHYTKSNGKGKLTPVDCPALSHISKGINDVQTLTAFRCLLSREVGKLLTERGGVRGAAKAFIPISIFAFLFKDIQTLKVAPQTYTFQHVSETSLEHIFYGEWRQRIHETGGQMTLCEVDLSSFTFRYRLPKQTLYCNFFVQRKKRQWEHGQLCWKAVEEHCIRSASVELVVHMGDGHIQALHVEEEWTLFECRRLLELITGLSEFHYLLDDKKVGYRREYAVRCKDCTPPHTLRINQND